MLAASVRQFGNGELQGEAVPRCKSLLVHYKNVLFVLDRSPVCNHITAGGHAPRGLSDQRVQGKGHKKTWRFCSEEGWRD